MRTHRRPMMAGAFLKTPELNVVVFSFLLNLVWEIWQMPFFRGLADQPYWMGVKACTLATLGDSGIALAAYWMTAVLARTRGWILEPRKLNIAIFVGVGIVATILLETLATDVLNRWAYGDNMPPCRFWEPGYCPLFSGWSSHFSLSGSCTARLVQNLPDKTLGRTMHEAGTVTLAMQVVIFAKVAAPVKLGSSARQPGSSNISAAYGSKINPAGVAITLSASAHGASETPTESEQALRSKQMDECFQAHAKLMEKPAVRSRINCWMAHRHLMPG